MDYLNSLVHLVKDNQLLAGGALVTIGGFVSNKIRAIPNSIINTFRKECFISLHVYDNDDTFFWLQTWVSKNFKARRDFMSYSNWRLDESAIRAPFSVIPAPGHHFGWYGKTPIWIQYTQEIKANSSGYSSRNYLLTFLSRDAKITEKFLGDCRDQYYPPTNRVNIYTSKNGGWYSGDFLPRKIESVIIPEKLKADLLKDLEGFILKKDWYSSIGIPHHRGYLFYGAPGNGKSSLISALAGKFNMNIYSMSLSSTTDDELGPLFYEMKQNSILLLEDIDCAFEERESRVTKLTFSALLNALDGIGARDGILVMMTTNHIEKLDAALIRPGRVDYKAELGNANYEQVYNLYSRFNPDAKKDEIEEFANQYGQETYSMAQLQGLLIRGDLDLFTPSIPLMSLKKVESLDKCESPF